MADVVIPIVAQMRAHRGCTKPLTHPVIKLVIRRETAMGCLVHENRQTKLARADQHDCENKCHRVRPDRKHRHGGNNNGPGMDDCTKTQKVRAFAETGPLILSEQLQRFHLNRRTHGMKIPAPETRRNRDAALAILHSVLRRRLAEH